MKKENYLEEQKTVKETDTDEKTYWLNELADVPEKSCFPYDYKEIAAKGRGLDHVKFTFPDELSSRLSVLSNRSDVRLHILLVTALVALLQRYTGRSDIIAGVPIYKQESEGYFINTVLPLRNRLKVDMTFKDLLLQVSRTTQKAAENQNISMEDLLYRLDIPYYGEDDFPLFDLSILLETIHDKKHLQSVHTNLAFSFSRDRENLEGTAAFNPGRYDKTTIERIIAHFKNLLRDVLFNVNLPLTQINILSEAEKKQLLEEFNDTRAAYPADKTIHQLFEEQAGRTPHLPAVCAPADLSRIYRELESPDLDVDLLDELGTCRFKQNPYIVKCRLEHPHPANHFTLLKTHRHNSVVVNNNIVPLLDLFDGKRCLKTIYSFLRDMDLKLLLYPGDATDILEITYRLRGAEVFSIPTFENFVYLLKRLYKTNLIHLEGINILPHDKADTPALDSSYREAFDQKKSSEDIPLDLSVPQQDPGQARVLLLGDTPGMPSTGLLYLASYLRRNGVTAYCRFNDSDRDYASMKQSIENLLQKIQPRVVAVSLKWFLYIARVLDICKIVNEYALQNGSPVKVVVGGNTASYYWEQLIRYDTIDVVIRGDGEEPLLKICREEENVPNTACKRNGDIVEHPFDYVQDETNSHEIYLSHLDEILLSKQTSLFGTFFIYTHKGCGMNCLYCGGCRGAQEKTFNRKKVLRRGVAEVRKDIVEARKYATTFQFDFDTFHKDLFNYCGEIWDQIDLSGHFCIITTLTPPSSQLVALAAKTFKYVYWDFDVCTLSQRHREQLVSLGLVKPMPSDEEIFAFFDRCEPHDNIEVRVNLITGLPYFTFDDIAPGENLLSEIMNTYSCFGELHWARLHAQPGAPITENADDYRMHSYAVTFQDYLTYSRKNFGSQSPHSELENLNYPYIYYNDDQLNSEITQFYFRNDKKINAYKERKKQEPPAPITLSYRRLNQKAHRLAEMLIEKGVKPGGIVGLLVTPSPDIPVGILGILKAGCAYLPIDPEFPAGRIRYMLNDCNAAVLVSGLSDPGGVSGWDGETVLLNELSDEPSTLHTHSTQPTQPAHPTHPCYVIYTSGTTGKPKGVVVTHENLVNYIWWFSRKARLTGDDRTMLTSSFAFDLGYTSIYTSLSNGGELHILPKEVYLSADRVLHYIKKQKITYMKLTPSLLSVYVNSPAFSRGMCRTLRLAAVGGEPIILKDIKKAHDVCPQLEILNHYGPTEATIGCIAAFVDFEQFDRYEAHPVIGKPVNNTVVHILDRDMNLLPVGVPGELCIGGTSLAAGYLNRPELTAEKFSTSLTPYPLPLTPYYRTGDRARWMSDGTVEFLGRVDNQIKIRGYRIELGEIENRLLSHNEIEDAVVTVREDKTGDRHIRAYYVPVKEETAASGGPSILTENEKTRYKRQMLLDGWGVTSQETLKRTTVFVAGAGGGASPTVMQLALAGFGTIIICDDDVVELSNLNRQFLHDPSRIGMNKALSAQMTINKINPEITVIPLTQRLTKENAFELVGDSDIIFDMFDGPESKFILSSCAVEKNIPHIIAAMTDISSYAAVFHPPATPCYHCLFDNVRFEALVSGMKSLVQEGEYEKKPLAVTASSLFVGSGFAVNEAVKIILGIRNPAYNKFFFFNQGGTEDIAKSEGFRSMTYIYSDFFKNTCKEQGFDWDVGWRGNFLEEFDVTPDPQCPVCGSLSPPAAGSVETGPAASESYSLTQLKEYLLQTLPEYMIPSYFVELEEMPLTPNGKIDKKALPEPGAASPGESFTAPRNKIEEKMAGIWAEVLGREKAGISMDSNFFDLGGHSLKVTMLVSKIQTEMNAVLPLSEIFKTPTIDKLARLIPGIPDIPDIPNAKDIQIDVPAVRDENLVLLRKGSKAPRHLFMLHAGGGEVEGFTEFCNYLNPGFNYWGIKASRLKNYAPENLLVEDMARKYIEKIRKVQPFGPYYIKGWCFGANIAIEMVRQLERMNQEVRFFSIINAYAPRDGITQGISKFTLESELDWITEYLGGDRFKEKLSGVSKPDQLWPFVVDYLEDVNFDVQTLRQFVPENMAEAIQNFDRLNRKEVIYYLNVVRSHLHARAMYEPAGKINTRVHYFKVTRGVLPASELWERYCSKPLMYHRVTGDHFSIFRGPEVEAFGKSFDKLLVENI